MNIKELSIGDWVQDGNGIIAKVRGIENWSDGYILNVQTVSGSICSLSATGALPIPLTPEILEKSGFVEMWGDFVVTHNGFYINIEVQENRFGLEVSADRHIIISCDVEFIHQLQHALRLAGVEKEIELC